MIEYELDSQELKWQRHQENIVGGITRLNDIKSVSQIDPPGVKKFPKQRAAVFEQVSEKAMTFLRQPVPVDMNPVDHFVSLLLALGSGTQDSHLKSVFLQ